METNNHNEIMRVLGNLEGKVDGINDRLNRVNGRLDKHDDAIGSLEALSNQGIGKQMVIGGVSGAVLGLIGAFISSNFIK